MIVMESLLDELERDGAARNVIRRPPEPTPATMPPCPVACACHGRTMYRHPAWCRLFCVPGECQRNGA